MTRLLNGQKPNVPAVNYQDLWWAGPSENGWGMSLTQKGEAVFGALYVYDAQGKPQWLVLPGGTWNATFDTFTASLYRPTGSPFTNYDRTRFVPGVPVGTASIKFRDGGTGTIGYVIDGMAGSKPITRQYFAEGRPTNNFTDLWWGGPTQDGWGLSITQQTHQLFAVWYTYGADGKVTWMVMPGGLFASSRRFVGKLYRTQGAPWLGVAYDPNRLAVTEVGQLELSFEGNDFATMRYTVDGVTGTNAITRQGF